MGLCGPPPRADADCDAPRVGADCDPPLPRMAANCDPPLPRIDADCDPPLPNAWCEPPRVMVACPAFPSGIGRPNLSFEGFPPSLPGFPKVYPMYLT